LDNLYLLAYATLVLSKLSLIFSHLLLLNSDYSHLSLIKTKDDFISYNPIPKVFLRNMINPPSNETDPKNSTSHIWYPYFKVKLLAFYV
jgi:hypothetical protein